VAEEWKSYIDLDGTHIIASANAPTTVDELLERSGLRPEQIVQNAAGTEVYALPALLGEAWQIADFAARYELVPRIQNALSVLAQVRSALNGAAPAGALRAVEQILRGEREVPRG